MKDILLVEDKKELAELIKAFLEQGGYQVYCVTQGEEAIDYLKRQGVKLIILDIMLPGIDGFAVCHKIREQQNIPILIMSARSDKSDQLKGYELGADDYMEKPVDPDILLAKVNALLKRSNKKQQEEKVLTSGEITIQQDSRKVYLKGKMIELTVKEYELLLLFIANTGKTLHKEYVFRYIWGMNSDSEYQTLTVHIKMLRSKIEENPKEPERIKTVWGVGYRYEEI